MKKAVVISQSPSVSRGYVETAKKHFLNHEIILLTQSESIAAQSFNNINSRIHTWFVDDYSNEELFLSCIDEISKQYEISYLLSNSEFDVLQCAKARDILSISGISYNEMLNFRDKVQMQQYFFIDGMKNIASQYIKSQHDIKKFIEENKADKYVIKPVSGAGSKGVYIIKTIDDIIENDDIYSGDMMIQPFISGDMYHIDFIASQKEILLFSPSRYMHPNYQFLDYDVISYMIDEQNPVYNKLYEILRNLVSQKDVFKNFLCCHLEVFIQGEDLYLCEIAARSGGGTIPESIDASFGQPIFDIFLEYIASYDKDPQKPLIPKQRIQYANMYMKTSKRVIKNLPFQFPDYVFYIEKTENHNAQHTADASIKAVVTGKSEKELVQNIQKFQDLIYK